MPAADKYFYLLNLYNTIWPAADNDHRPAADNDPIYINYMLCKKTVP